MMASALTASNILSEAEIEAILIGIHHADGFIRSNPDGTARSMITRLSTTHN